VDKPVDNVWKSRGKRVDKAFGYPHNALCHFHGRDIHRVISGFCKSFPPFSTHKRYKLINFAPKKEIVDKTLYSLKIRKKELTICVDNLMTDVNNGKSKKKDKKFCTFPRHIIPLHTFSLKLKKERI
jgi:hypothetical protein